MARSFPIRLRGAFINWGKVGIRAIISNNIKIEQYRDHHLITH